MLNLFTNAGENTLPEQVEVNKQNIQLLAAEIEKLGYTPKGEYSAETEYKYNDVVFYDYKLYSMIKDDGVVVGVLPTNTEYWQAVTGNIKGQTGAQGAQGPQGADGQDGADGLSALVCHEIVAQSGISGITSDLQIYIHDSAFNRQTVAGDLFMAIAKDTNNDKVFVIPARVVTPGVHTIPTSNATVTLQCLRKVQISGNNGQNGADGATGEIALVYDQNIPFTRSSASEQLINTILYYENFNREPQLNEDFIGILVDNGIAYLAQCEVQTKEDITGHYVSSIVASNIYRITGEQGLQGPQGEQGLQGPQGEQGPTGANGQDGAVGLPALEYGIRVIGGSIPVADATQMAPNNSNFNRTPVVGDYTNVLWTYDGHTYMCIFTVTAVGETTSTLLCKNAVDITGQGASLYMHNMSFNINNASLFGTCRLTIVTSDADPYVTGTSLTTRGRAVFDKTIGANGYANTDRQVVGIRYNSSNQYIVFMTVPKNVTEYQAQSSGPSAILTEWQVYDTVVAL